MAAADVLPLVQLRIVVGRVRSYIRVFVSHSNIEINFNIVSSRSRYLILVKWIKM
jgi:hypothetical protein